MKQLKKTILTLVALLALTAQAWAMWTGGTYTATASEVNWNSVNVTDDATLTINQDVSVTTGSISISAGKTLTVVGPGHLVVNGGITGSGTIIVKGNALLLVYSADGSEGAPGDDGSNGGDGAAAIMCSITIYSGSIQAYGGDGGAGGNGDDDGGSGGDGGDGAPAFGGSGTLTYYGGSIEASGGSGGNAGEGSVPGESGEQAMAFADTYNVVFENQPTSIKDDIDDPIDINNIKGTWYIGILGDDADAVTGPTAPEVAWDKTSKTGTFTMPGGNVTLEPEYYPQAALTAAPTAINDVPATTDGAIVKAGTVNNIGETTTAQGTVMYYVSTTALDDAALLALAADKWTADVPTAKSLAQGQAYVYYYVRGNDSDTDEENFSDGDILAANALTVTIAAEPTYAVTFAEGTDPNEWTASPNTDVKKGQTVTVTYSGDRKVIGVKAEKKAAEPVTLATALEDGAVVKIDYTWDGVHTIFTFTNNGGTYSCTVTGNSASNFAASLTKNGNTLTFVATNAQWNEANLNIGFYAMDNGFYFNQKGSYYQTFTISVNGTDVKDQLSEWK